jgi:hypothetical protein
MYVIGIESWAADEKFAVAIPAGGMAADGSGTGTLYAGRVAAQYQTVTLQPKLYIRLVASSATTISRTTQLRR